MSAINVETLRDAIYDWIFGETADAVIFAYENGPQPDLDSVPRFFVVNISSIDQIGQDYLGLPDGAGDIEITGNREFTCSIQCKGTGAIDKLEDLRSSLEKPSVQAGLRASNIAIVDTLALTDLTALDDTTFIRRGSLDVLMRTHSIITDTVGFFNKTNVTGEYKSVTGTVVYTEEFTVDASS